MHKLITTVISVLILFMCSALYPTCSKCPNDIEENWKFLGLYVSKVSASLAFHSQPVCLWLPFVESALLKVEGGRLTRNDKLIPFSTSAQRKISDDEKKNTYMSLWNVALKSSNIFHRLSKSCYGELVGMWVKWIWAEYWRSNTWSCLVGSGPMDGESFSSYLLL